MLAPLWRVTPPPPSMGNPGSAPDGQFKYGKFDSMLNYRPQTKFAKVMFLHLSVSHSVHRGGTWAGTPPGRYTPWAGTPPGAVHAGRYGQQAGSTHPTGMHSCLILEFSMNFFPIDTT